MILSFTFRLFLWLRVLRYFYYTFLGKFDDKDNDIGEDTGYDCRYNLVIFGELL